MKLTIPCYSVLQKPCCFRDGWNTYLHFKKWIIFTFVPFSKSNNLTHTAHNGTDVTLNECENACLDYD